MTTTPARSEAPQPAPDEIRTVMERATTTVLALIRESGWPPHPGGPVPWDINRGRCVDWAQLVYPLIPGTVMAEWDDPRSAILHTFNVLGGRFYELEDVNSANAVADLTDHGGVPAMLLATRPPLSSINHGRAADWARRACGRIPGAALAMRDDPKTGALNTSSSWAAAITTRSAWPAPLTSEACRSSGIRRRRGRAHPAMR
jgi:hypothetical protein